MVSMGIIGECFVGYYIVGECTMGVGVIGMGEGMGGCWAWLGKFPSAPSVFAGGNIQFLR